jgi:glycosyltransferase involved in cell wall biosynthesis
MSLPMLISVIIPAYNIDKYLAESLDSVLAQTYPHFEVIIVNDGSTDRTLEIAQEYAAKDDRIRVVSQLNQGISGARNHGIRETTGELLAFLDGDDRWHPDKLNAHINHFQSFGQDYKSTETKSLGMSFAKVTFITFDGSYTYQYSNAKLTNLNPEDFYIENPVVTPSNVVIRRSVFDLVGHFALQLRSSEDQELFVRIACSGTIVEGLNTVLTEYRIVEDSVSANLYRMEENWQLLNRCIEIYAPSLVKHHYDRAYAYFLRYLARRGIRIRAKPQQTQAFIWRAIRQDRSLLFTEPKRTLATLFFAYVPNLSLKSF